MFDFNASYRAQDVQTVPRTTLSLSNIFGIFDPSRPSEDRINRDMRGLFWSLINRRANQMARALLGTQGAEGLRVMRITGQGDMEEATSADSPWVDLIQRPNDAMPAYKTWHWMEMAVCAAGTADFVIEDDMRGVPVAMYPIYPAWGDVRPVLDAVGGIDEWIFHRADGEDVKLEARDIVRFSLSGVADPANNKSLIERAVFELDHEYYSKVYEQGFIKDGIPPYAYISYDGDVDTARRQSIGKQFKNKFFGSQSTQTIKGIPVMDKGGELKTFSINPKDLAMLDNRQFNREMLYDITGWPFNLTSDTANRSNAEVAERTLVRDLINPRLTEIASEMTHAFERSFGTEPGALEVVAPDMTPVDKEQQARIDRIRIETGQRTPNELRQRDGEEEYEGDVGDMPMVSSTLQPLGAEPQPFL